MINEPRSGQLTVAELIDELANADPNALVGFAIDSALLQEVAQSSVGLDVILLPLRVRSVVGPAITLEPVPSVSS